MKLHLSVPRMDYASLAANLDIFLGSALRNRNNWLFVQLAAEMAVVTTGPPTITLGLLLLLVVMLTTLMLKKLRINLLP